MKPSMGGITMIQRPLPSVRQYSVYAVAGIFENCFTELVFCGRVFALDALFSNSTLWKEMEIVEKGGLHILV